MLSEILNAIAAVATIGGFLLEVFERVCRLRKGKNTHVRETREEAIKKASENK
ncbi:MAG: hypothetical protein KHY83_10750 [Coriobacteriia bacterium]|nr:hypothetical protein [Coriobacteriia bacterium]MBS5479126.1 hypothetical protein [Coriobacteriia bacterium]